MLCYKSRSIKHFRTRHVRAASGPLFQTENIMQHEISVFITRTLEHSTLLDNRNETRFIINILVYVLNNFTFNVLIAFESYKVFVTFFERILIENKSKIISLK